MVTEFLKSRLHQGQPPDLHFWRDSQGLEVDLLVEWAGSLDPVQVKSGQTIAADFFHSLKRWNELAGRPEAPAWLVYGGAQRLRSQGVEVVPWEELAQLTQNLAASRPALNRQ